MYSAKDPRTLSAEQKAQLPFTLTGEEYVSDAHPGARAYPTTRGTIFINTEGGNWFEVAPEIWKEGDDPINGPFTGSLLSGMRKT